MQRYASAQGLNEARKQLVIFGNQLIIKLQVCFKTHDLFLALYKIAVFIQGVPGVGFDTVFTDFAGADVD
ncbi:hypothetical protein D3C71_1227340 [compost metagenome]